MNQQTQTAANPEFGRPVDVVLSASRAYLIAVGRSEVASERQRLAAIFDEAALNDMYRPLLRVLDCLIASATVPLIVNEVNSRGTSFHEQAFIMALRSLQNRNPHGYRMTMAAILPPAAVEQAYTDMTVVAGVLSRIEECWSKGAPVVSGRQKRAPASNNAGSVH